jgi:hypothetical protein
VRATQPALTISGEYGELKGHARKAAEPAPRATRRKTFAGGEERRLTLFAITVSLYHL